MPAVSVRRQEEQQVCDRELARETAEQEGVVAIGVAVVLVRL